MVKKTKKGKKNKKIHKMIQNIIKIHIGEKKKEKSTTPYSVPMVSPYPMPFTRIDPIAPPVEIPVLKLIGQETLQEPEVNEVGQKEIPQEFINIGQAKGREAPTMPSNESLIGREFLFGKSMCTVLHYDGRKDRFIVRREDSNGDVNENASFSKDVILRSISK